MDRTKAAGNAVFPALVLAAACVLVSLTACSRNRTVAETGAVTPEKTARDGKPAEAGIVLLSTQFNPVEEAGKIRSQVLKGFAKNVEFRPVDSDSIIAQVSADVSSPSGRSVVIGALHGDLLTLRKADALEPLDPIVPRLRDRVFFPDLLARGKLDQEALYYIPWIQASYIMIADRKALKYLPKGTQIASLTYERMIEWGRNMQEATGSPKIGFPAGEKGLLHRFLQGYLYPSYTGSTLLRFKTDAAVRMWQDLISLWRYVTPASLVYTNMSQPLLTGEVWVAWDHTARILEALETRPDDFVLFPAPGGPAGRGYMTVLAGLAVPRSSSSRAREDAAELIEYLTRPSVQETVLEQTGFFPVVEPPARGDPSGARMELRKAIAAQAAAPGAIATLLPMGLRDKGQDFNAAYLLAFSRIVLKNDDIRTALAAMGERLQKILDETGASSWPPDADTGTRPRLE